MMFELSPEQVAARDKARAFAGTLAGQAAEIDASAVVPADVAREVTAMSAGHLSTLVLAVEEIAAASPAAATSAVAASGGSALAMTGLRGAFAVEASTRGHLALAAVALGIGRAAVEAALRELRDAAAGARDVEKPHWVVADAATELDAARLLTYKAAQTGADADVALARLMASAAAARAVDAAVRVVGQGSLMQGSEVERLARDVRAVSVLVGTEEDQRTVAAEGLLPH